MQRFNYLPTRPTRRLGGRGLLIAIDNRIRGPLAALVCTFVLVAVGNAIQLARLHAAHALYLRAQARLSADEPALRDLALLRARVLAAARRDDRVALLRRRSLAGADELVQIGNRLPARTWLERVQFAQGEYDLEGGAERVGDVGTALLSLRDPERTLDPQLVWLHAGSADGGHVRYRLRLRQRS